MNQNPAPPVNGQPQHEAGSSGDLGDRSRTRIDGVHLSGLAAGVQHPCGVVECHSLGVIQAVDEDLDGVDHRHQSTMAWPTVPLITSPPSTTIS